MSNLPVPEASSAGAYSFDLLRKCYWQGKRILRSAEVCSALAERDGLRYAMEKILAEAYQEDDIVGEIAKKALSGQEYYSTLLIERAKLIAVVREAIAEYQGEFGPFHISSRLRKTLRELGELE